MTDRGKGSSVGAVILAAGLGSRLKPLTDRMPKCLTEVHGTPILINALDALAANDIDETTLVIGYLGDRIRNAVGDSHDGMSIRYVESDVYESTNTSYSLWIALKEWKTPGTVLIIEGDVFFERRIIDRLLGCPDENLVVLEPYNPFLDGSFVSIDGNNRLTAWWHKSHQPAGFILEDKYKTVNIHKFDRTFVQDIMMPGLKDVMLETAGKAPLEYVMEEIVEKGSPPIQALMAGESKWFEIDDARDLAKAEEVFGDDDETET